MHRGSSCLQNSKMASVVKWDLFVGVVKGQRFKGQRSHVEVKGHGSLPVLFCVDHFRFFFRVDFFSC